MPYGNKARTVRAYEFGTALGPSAGEAETVEAMSCRVRLWNNLVELSQAFQRDRGVLLRPHVPLGAEGKERYAAIKAALALPEVSGPIGRLEEGLRQAARALCRQSGLYWCNYEEVLGAWQNARRSMPVILPGEEDQDGNGQERGHRKRRELRFHRASLEPGKVTVRWQTGLPVADAFGDDRRMRIDPVPELAWSSPLRSERRRLARTILSLRVASDERGKPVWLRLPFVMHRSLPPDGLVRQASVLRERVGLTWRWKVVIVAETPESTARPRSGGRISLELGWRRLPPVDGQPSPGMRVCAWRDDSGQEGQLILPADWLSEMGKTEDLRSIRDRAFNETRAAVRAWLVTARDVPIWLREATATIAQWGSPARLWVLANRWRQSRFQGDESIFGGLDDWWKREQHLYEYESHLRDQLLRRRREIYRRFAADLARRYGEVLLKDLDLRVLATRAKKGGKADEMVKRARYGRFVASPSTLRAAVVNAFEREGGIVTEIPSPYTTMICAECGSLEVFDKAAGSEYRCSGCGTGLDRDANVARNLPDQESPQEVGKLD